MHGEENVEKRTFYDLSRALLPVRGAGCAASRSMERKGGPEGPDSLFFKPTKPRADSAGALMAPLGSGESAAGVQGGTAFCPPLGIARREAPLRENSAFRSSVS